MRILLDTSVILDVLLNRKPWAMDAAEIWRMCSNNRVNGYICASSFTDIFYIARRLTDLARARAAIRLCLITFAVCPVDRDILDMADQMQGNDFEDNLQIACAVAGNMDIIVTRDLEGFRHSSIQVMTPSDFLSMLSISP